MKTFQLKNILSTIMMLIVLGLQAQTTTQNINYGDVKNYAVDTAEGTEGTPGSTYEWSVLDSSSNLMTGPFVITSQTTSKNSIRIDWNTTPAGTYTLKVVETNNGCKDEKEIKVIIAAVQYPVLTADNAQICSTDTTTFSISNAAADSKISYTITGGTTTNQNPITVDDEGKATITVTPNAGVDEIVVTLTKMELSTGTIVDLAAQNISATTTVMTTTTSAIEFD